MPDSPMRRLISRVKLMSWSVCCTISSIAILREKNSRPSVAPASRGDNTRSAIATTIAGFAAHSTHVRVGDDTIALWSVAALERYVDRAALLSDEDPPEPPYWAHLWSGA